MRCRYSEVRREPSSMTIPPRHVVACARAARLREADAAAIMCHDISRTPQRVRPLPQSAPWAGDTRVPTTSRGRNMRGLTLGSASPPAVMRYDTREEGSAQCPKQQIVGRSQAGSADSDTKNYHTVGGILKIASITGVTF